MSLQILDDLNEQQKKAVAHKNGPLLIVAGAGTGKTMVITRRIAWLIEQKLAKPEEILALTFTDKSAAEMEERVDRALPYGYVNVWVSTFHSFGERVLKDYALEIGLPNDFRVLSTTEQWMLARNNIHRFNLNYYRPIGNPTKFIHALIQHFSRAKDEIVNPDDYLRYVDDLCLNIDSDPPPRGDVSPLGGGEAQRLREIAEAYHTYQQLLVENDCFDFGDLINYTLKLLQARPRVLNELRQRFKYILVDEFQDTNIAQYELVKILAAPQNNITVVGDDDQSIYKFRSASISNILGFKKDYPDCQEIFLTENYRSYQNILDTAHKFIQLNNPYRLEVALGGKHKTVCKKLVASRQGRAEIACFNFRTAEDEAEGVANKILELQRKRKASFGDFAILARANSSVPIFLQALRRHNIPFEYAANRGLYKTQIILDIISYLKLLDNYHESESLYRVLTSEPFILPHADLVALTQYARQKTISLYSALRALLSSTLSEPGRAIIDRLLGLIASHSALTKTKSAAEIYVQIVRDLDIEERVEHPALARDAQYLAAFYKQIQRFEMNSDNHYLSEFLKYLQLELDSGEQGQLPEDFEEGPETVKVTTAHAAKGLEWPYVFIVHLIDRRFPSSERREPIELPEALIKETLPEGDAHLQEERRLFYVAMTRARDGLYFTRAEDYFGKTTRKPSQFLQDLGMIDKTASKPSRTQSRVSDMPEIAATSAPRYPIPESFSFSSVSCFHKCPLEYKFRHLLKLPGPGNGQMSFGVTIHKTLELFLKLWQERTRNVQGDLFGPPLRDGAPSLSGGRILPTMDELKEIYERNWIDDWYEDAQQKARYKDKQGPVILSNFYGRFKENPPNPKYLEQWFKIPMGQYKFVGKIDRIDQQDNGVVIIDYKTGQTAPEKIQKVDREQIIIYQIAAQEFLNEQVAGAMYWYLVENQFTDSFVATAEQIAKVKNDYTQQIENIIKTIKDDSFIQAHENTGQHACAYQRLI